MIKKCIDIIRQDKKSMITISCLVMLFFGINMFFCYATDTYFTFYNGFKMSAIDMFLRNGRPVIAIIYAVHYWLGLPAESFYYISSLLAILFLIISIFVMQNILKKYNIDDKHRIIISFTSIANIFIIEYFMFIEKCGFLIGILFCLIGVWCITVYFRENNKLYYGFAFLFIILAIFSYQGTVALFVLLSIPFAYRHADNIKQYFVRIIQIGLVYGMAVLMVLFAFKFVFNQTRISEKPNYFENIKNVLVQLFDLKTHTLCIFPEHFFEIIMIFIIISDLILAMFCKKRLFRIFHIIVLFFSCCIFPVATLIQGTGWIAMRIIFPIASIVGVFALDFCLNNNFRKIESNSIIRILDKGILLLLLVLMVAQYFSFNKIFIDKYKLNSLDENRAYYVGQAISEYEQETGCKIKNIAFYYDAKCVYPHYSGLYAGGGDVIVSAYYTSWSNIRALNYYLQTEYEKVEQDAQYREYFYSRNWDNLSKEQMIFDGETLHLCEY